MLRLTALPLEPTVEICRHKWCLIRVRNVPELPTYAHGADARG